jgi:hypothetical protein
MLDLTPQAIPTIDQCVMLNAEEVTLRYGGTRNTFNLESYGAGNAFG